MVYENIKIFTSNLAVGRDGSEFYTMDHETNQLIKKQQDGTVIFSHFLDTLIGEVESLEFDGVHFWSLERQGISGCRVRKWLIDTEDDLCKMQEEFSYTSDSTNSYDTYALAVEHYRETLGIDLSVGEDTTTVEDGEIIKVGDRIIIGPSTAVGYEGMFFSASVSAKTDLDITLSSPSDVLFSPGDEIYFTRSFFIFSDLGPSGSSGALYKYNAFNGVALAVDSSNLYNLVRGATFFKNKVMFVRGGDVVWLSPETFDIFRFQAIDNLNQQRTEYLECLDLAGFSNTLYRLETAHVFLEDGEYGVEEWGNQRNYNTSSVIPEVYFVGVKVEPPILHRAVAGLTPTSNVVVQVLDQFRTPVIDRPVSLSSDSGSVSPTSGNTDAEGQFFSVYTASTAVGQVTIVADVL